MKELPFSEKSDIYSFGIVLWELTNRCIKGYYQRPFSEFPGIHVDFQILVQASSKNLRPTLSKNTPLNKLYQSCVVAEPDDRPKGSEVLENLIKFERDFQTNPHSWNSLINTQSNTKA